MNRRLKIILISAASALGLTAGAAALHAQSQDGYRHHARFGHHGGMHFMCTQGTERLEDILTFAQIRLDIRDDQKPAWEIFTAAVKDGGQSLLTSCDRMDVLRGGMAPERLAEMEVVMEKALGAVKQIRTAFDPLYTVLDDDQKATLERLTKHRGPHGMHGGPDGDGPGGFDGPGRHDGSGPRDEMRKG